jgi:hypothetical protein
MIECHPAIFWRDDQLHSRALSGSNYVKSHVLESLTDLVSAENQQVYSPPHNSEPEAFVQEVGQTANAAAENTPDGCTRFCSYRAARNARRP